jgi:hypothetical protein
LRIAESVFAIFVAFAAVNVNAEVALPNSEQDRMAIERLHQQDIAATLSDDADQLARLWDEDAVRLQSGSPAEIGKGTICSNDKRWQAHLHGGRTLSYKPDYKRCCRDRKSDQVTLSPLRPSGRAKCNHEYLSGNPRMARIQSVTCDMSRHARLKDL